MGPLFTRETSSLPVRRHQAGRSSSTEISVDRISSRPPRPSGSMCLRMSSSSPFPQSRSPPSKLASGACGWRSTTFIGSIGNAGRAGTEELDELGASDDRRARDEVGLVQTALLEAGRADPDLPARLDEIVHQFLEGRETLLADVVGVALLRQPHAL